MADMLPVPPDQLATISNLLNTLGGQRTTVRTSPGDTRQLEAVIAGLQGQDFEALLQSIFQQAAAEIPGLQQAYANAMGARTGRNTSIEAALQELLKQTTLAGQQQIASQQAQNFQTQAQAAQGIAQATTGTKQETQQRTNLGAAAQGIAALQLLSMLTGTKEEPGLIRKGIDTIKGFGQGETVSPVATGVASPVAQMSAAPISSPAAMPTMSFAPTGGGLGFQGTLPGGGGFTAPTYTPANFSLAPSSSSSSQGLAFPQMTWDSSGWQTYQPTNFGNIFSSGAAAPFASSGGLGSGLSMGGGTGLKFDSWW